MEKNDAIRTILSKVDVYVRARRAGKRKRFYDVVLLDGRHLDPKFKDYYEDAFKRLRRQLEAMPDEIVCAIGERENALSPTKGVHIVLMQGESGGISPKERRAIFSDVPLHTRKDYVAADYQQDPLGVPTKRYSRKNAIVTINMDHEISARTAPANSDVSNGFVIHELGHYYLDYCIPDREQALIAALNAAVTKDKEHTSSHMHEILVKSGKTKVHGQKIDVRQEYFCRLLTQLCGANYIEDENDREPYFKLAQCANVRGWIDEYFPAWNPLVEACIRAQSPTTFTDTPPPSSLNGANTADQAREHNTAPSSNGWAYSLGESLLQPRESNVVPYENPGMPADARESDAVTTNHAAKHAKRGPHAAAHAKNKAAARSPAA